MSHPLFALPLTLLLHLQLVLLGTVSLAWNLVALLLYPLLSAERGRKLGRWAIACAYGSFWRVAACTGMLRIDASALDVLAHEPGLIIMANHPSMLDALILVSRLPRSACIMKAALMRNVFLSAGARLARYICNDSARGMVRLAVADLKRGGQLVIFPEGTRTTTPPVNPFRPGITLIAKLANAPIQTVFIDTDTPYLGKGWPIWKLPPLPVVFKVRLGERFAPSSESASLLAELERYTGANVRCSATRTGPRADADAKAGAGAGAAR